MTIDTRPPNCRFRLRDEGKAYPRSGCLGCGKTITTGLGTECSIAAAPSTVEQFERQIDADAAEWDTATKKYLDAQVTLANAINASDLSESAKVGLAMRIFTAAATVAKRIEQWEPGK
jgi:hypothetical protein